MDLWMLRAILLKQKTHRLSLRECHSAHLGKHFGTDIMFGKTDMYFLQFSYFSPLPCTLFSVPGWRTLSKVCSAPRKILSEHFLLREIETDGVSHKTGTSNGKKSLSLATRRELLNLSPLADYSRFVRVLYSVDWCDYFYIELSYPSLKFWRSNKSIWTNVSHCTAW